MYGKTVMVVVWGAASACLLGGCARTRTVRADALIFQASNRWQEEAPSHKTRRLQFSVLSGHDELDPAKLVVWHFPEMRDAGDGYLIEKNMERWCEQFAPDGRRPCEEFADRVEYRINGLPVYTIDLSGRYIGETAPGSGVRLDEPNYRLIGAYIVAPHGDYIVKLVGPASVVAENKPAFDTFIRSVRADDGSRFVRQRHFWPGQSKAVLTTVRTRP